MNVVQRVSETELVSQRIKKTFQQPVQRLSSSFYLNTHNGTGRDDVEAPQAAHFSVLAVAPFTLREF